MRRRHAGLGSTDRERTGTARGRHPRSPAPLRLMPLGRPANLARKAKREARSRERVRSGGRDACGIQAETRGGRAEGRSAWRADCLPTPRGRCARRRHSAPDHDQNVLPERSRATIGLARGRAEGRPQIGRCRAGGCSRRRGRRPPDSRAPGPDARPPRRGPLPVRPAGRASSSPSGMPARPAGRASRPRSARAAARAPPRSPVGGGRPPAAGPDPGPRSDKAVRDPRARRAAPRASRRAAASRGSARGSRPRGLLAPARVAVQQRQGLCRPLRRRQGARAQQPAAPVQLRRQIVPDLAALERAERRRGIRRAQPELGELGAGLGPGGTLEAPLDQLAEQRRGGLDQIEIQPAARRAAGAPGRRRRRRPPAPGDRDRGHRRAPPRSPRPGPPPRRWRASRPRSARRPARRGTRSADPARRGAPRHGRRSADRAPPAPGASALPRDGHATARAPGARLAAASAGPRRPASRSSCTRA